MHSNTSSRSLGELEDRRQRGEDVPEVSAGGLRGANVPEGAQEIPRTRPSSVPRSGQRMKRSQSHEPVPLKDKVYTTLCRFRYGWSFRSSVDIIVEVPIWLLGQCYHAEEKEKGRYNQDTEGAPRHILSFMEHFNTLVWMTYRTNFPAIAGTSITTDCGWGCMVRSGQMILATALNHYLLGPDWRLGKSISAERVIHRQILSWFADTPDPRCPFSLHSLMEVAVRLGNRPGDWFGPSQLAVLIRECVGEAREKHQQLQNLLVYMAHDCTVYMGDIDDLYDSHPERSLLLLVPVRLGSEALNPIYIPCVKSLLALDHCVGIIGGKPKHSVYFVGFQDDKLVHLDPHFCQAATDVPEDPTYKDFDLKSYHCNTPRKLPAKRMDPSCTVGFLCRSQQELHTLRTKAEKVLAPPLQRGVYPFFSFSDKRQAEVLDLTMDTHMISSENFSYDGFIMEDGFDGGPEKEGKRKRRGRDHFEDLTINEDEDFVVVECRRSTPSSGDSTPKLGATDSPLEPARLSSINFIDHAHQEATDDF